jgi:prefoldin subunit 5
MPNGHADQYIREWCDERHERLDTEVREMRQKIDKLTARVTAVVAIGTAVGTILSQLIVRWLG